AGFDKSYKVGGGLLGAVEKGTTVSFEQRFEDGDVWLPSYSAIHARVRLLIFKGLHFNVVNTFSDYKVFNVQTLNKMGSPLKRN
ncbi:MAG: hypothetical protein KGM47_01005, partial [Acidobacteriota bacterium]|nr:hypothetical protein [Acidobacteriota bacterium]